MDGCQNHEITEAEPKENLTESSNLVSERCGSDPGAQPGCCLGAQNLEAKPDTEKDLETMFLRKH